MVYNFYINILLLFNILILLDFKKNIFKTNIILILVIKNMF